MLLRKAVVEAANLVGSGQAERITRAAGCGKTTVLQGVMWELEGRGVRVHQITGFMTHRNVPFSGLHPVLDADAALTGLAIFLRGGVEALPVGLCAVEIEALHALAAGNLRAETNGNGA